MVSRTVQLSLPGSRLLLPEHRSGRVDQKPLFTLYMKGERARKTTNKQTSKKGNACAAERNEATNAAEIPLNSP